MQVSPPPELIDAVSRAAAGHGQRQLTADAERISLHYRAARPSRQAVQGEGDAVAYALSRLPATYAAMATVLAEVQDRAPDFSPSTLLDAGAGPGTAAWAAVEAWQGLQRLVLADDSQDFLKLARVLAADSGREALERADVVTADISRLDLKAGVFDVVTCGYALTELSDVQLLPTVERLWSHCTGVLVIVEPGRPRDYERLLAVRGHLLALGGRVLAPCPHEAPCPLVAPDWCHFSVRLSRTREHMRAKGGTLGYEDEKFSYLVVAREGIGKPAAGRIIKPRSENKFSATLEICAAGEVEHRVLPSRDKAAFKAARKLDWGDAI